MRRRARPALALLAAVATVAVSGCAGGGSDDSQAEGKSPDEVMAAAKQHLDETSGVNLKLSTDDEPKDGDYLASAEGTITTQPAFEGKVAGRVLGIPASDIDVIAVDGDVWVDVPIQGWTTYDPSKFCAPDPATLLDPDSGVSSVLTAATDLEAGDAERGGADNDQILTPYTGTVPGDAIRAILPCSEGEEFEATFRVDDEGYLRSAELTGEFFPGTDDITYTIDVQEYDVERDISAPQ